VLNHPYAVLYRAHILCGRARGPFNGAPDDTKCLGNSTSSPTGERKPEASAASISGTLPTVAATPRAAIRCADDDTRTRHAFGAARQQNDVGNRVHRSQVRLSPQDAGVTAHTLCLLSQIETLTAFVNTDRIASRSGTV
jgi:hypothetical protein